MNSKKFNRRSTLNKTIIAKPSRTETKKVPGSTPIFPENFRKK